MKHRQRYGDTKTSEAMGNINKQKKAIMQAALRKVHHMASDAGMLYKSAQDKLREFARAGYPKGVRRYVCVGLGHATGNEAWFVISRLQR